MLFARRPDRELTPSGGETRARLAFYRCRSRILLLLDEPTNFLDMALFWLEKFLKDWRRILLVAPHDRYFLTGGGAHFCASGRRSQSYSGNYSAYFNRFQQEQIELARGYRQRQELLARESRLIRESAADQRPAPGPQQAEATLDKLEGAAHRKNAPLKWASNTAGGAAIW